MTARNHPSTTSRHHEIVERGYVVTSSNDRLSEALSDLVPQKYRGTDRYLDIVQWNLEYFGADKSVAKDAHRFGIVVDTLAALNADLFVLQEIAGPSNDGRYPGALDAVAEELTRRGAGHYVVYYTRAGGEQRVAMMWDRDWLRAKTEVEELFPRGTHTFGSPPKDAFAGRTPLYGYFAARIPSDAARREGPRPRELDFQVLGVHLKAMEDGYPQRKASASVLSSWLRNDAPRTDADVLVIGDFNAPPSDQRSWGPFYELEDHGNAAFRSINDESDFSYLWMRNKGSDLVSRIDLAVVSLSAVAQAQTLAQPILWRPIEETLAQAGDLTSSRVRAVMRDIKENLSDHLPVVSRFYFEPPARGIPAASGASRRPV